MKKVFFLFLFMTSLSGCLIAQASEWQKYEPNEIHPYGMRDPQAPASLDDFAPMIGTCDCKSQSRNPDGTWQDSVDMIWTFKYIMNGTAIQDEVWRENSYATSIRLFNPDSAVWVVSYHSNPSVSMRTPTWIGKKADKDIVLYMDQMAPNGMEGSSRLTFTDISFDGFHWRGEWVNEEQGIVYPFWLIWCKKRKI